MSTHQTTLEARAFRLGKEAYGAVKPGGLIVQSVDLRLRFGIGAAANDRLSAGIVAHVAGRVTGIAVDSVSDVVRRGPDDIRPAPAMGTAVDADRLSGLGPPGERMPVPLDIERLVASEQFGPIARRAA